MKILHIIPTYLPADLVSGPIQVIHSLNQELVNLGVEVTVYTSNSGGNKILDVPTCKEILIDGVKVFYFPLTFKPWFYSIGLHRALKKNTKDFDLIHISGIFLSMLTLAAHYGKKFNIPYIISPHGMLMKRPLLSKWLKKKLYLSIIEKKNIANAAGVHFTTELEKEEYLEVRFPATKAIVIPHGISLKEAIPHLDGNLFRKKFNIPKNKKIVFFMGRLNWIKGFDTLLPAFADVVKGDTEAVLLLSGPDGGYQQEIDSMVDILKIKDKVIHTGPLEGEEKVAALCESSVLVLTSYSENFSVVAAEAMSLGLPVVITRGVGIWSIVKDYGAGIVVEKEINEVSSALLKILNNPELAQEMGEKGKRLVSVEFNPSQVASKMKNVYEEVI